MATTPGGFDSAFGDRKSVKSKALLISMGQSMGAENGTPGIRLEWLGSRWLFLGVDEEWTSDD